MCELKSCLCDEGVSDVKFTCKDSGWDIADTRVGCHDDGNRNRCLFGLWRVWGKCRSFGEGDWLSPESLFGRGEGWGLTVWSVGGRLAPVTTASLINGGLWRGFDLAGFREWSGLNGWCEACGVAIAKSLA